ncbi:MAG: hypothetical protein SGJ23_10630 [Alphaproteobacteria bacterium]|nr:hypothetical protein [Alphaproteobacteria bacterium]
MAITIDQRLEKIGSPQPSLHAVGARRLTSRVSREVIDVGIVGAEACVFLVLFACRVGLKGGTNPPGFLPS